MADIEITFYTCEIILGKNSGFVLKHLFFLQITVNKENCFVCNITKIIKLIKKLELKMILKVLMLKYFSFGILTICKKNIFG